MKTKNKIILSVIAVTMILFFAQCTKSNSSGDVPVFSYLTPPSAPNPVPDVFQLVFNISTYGDKEAIIVFDTNAVWLVEKLGDGRINFWVSSDTALQFVSLADTFAFKKGNTYTFVANNNNYEEFNNFFTQFNKLAIDYDTYEPKF